MRTVQRAINPSYNIHKGENEPPSLGRTVHKTIKNLKRSAGVGNAADQYRNNYY